MESGSLRLRAIDHGLQVSFDVNVEKSGGMRKRARFESFAFECDEGPLLGGENSAPPPMVYFAASLAF